MARARPKARPYQLKEVDIKAQIKDYLLLKGYWIFPTAGSTYHRKGIPDIIFGGHGRWGGIEAKGPRGRVSLEQRRDLDLISEKGGLAILAWSLDDVMEVL